MKAGTYVCLCIIMLLILIFLITRYYLVYNYTNIVTVNDGELLDIFCLKDKHDIEIFYAGYRIRRGNKINMTAALSAVLQNGQLEQNNWIFNASDYNLPKNGKLTFRFKCNTCNLHNKSTIQNVQNQNVQKNNYEPKRIDIKYTPYVPELPTSFRNADQIPILPGNSQSNIERDSYGVSAESAQYPNMITGVGKRDLIQKLTPSSVNFDDKNDNLSSFTDLDSLLTNLKESELTGDSPMSFVTNVFDRKYPQISLTSKLAHIDPEYLPNGLFNDAQGLNNLLSSSKGWGKDTSAGLDQQLFVTKYNNTNNNKTADRRPMFTDGEVGMTE